MQYNEKIIMNPPTVFCHLAGSLTQSIRSNEPRLIFTRDEEIGSFQPTRFRFSSADLPVFEINMKDCEGEGGTKAAERTKAGRRERAEGDVAEERGEDTEPKRNKVWAKRKEWRRAGEGERAAMVVICLPT